MALQVNNTGDRPVQIGSHYHFFEVNRALVFDRESAYGMRLDLPGVLRCVWSRGKSRRSGW